eukprot:g31379.t1
MQRGTDGSLSYLSSVLLYAWKAAEYQFPVVEAMMQRTGLSAGGEDPTARNDSSGEILMKAGCAASYAQLLGDITQMYGDLSDSKVECFVPTLGAIKTRARRGAENTTQVHWRKCAFDATQSLQMVTQAISEAANAMWQCFGIYWGCSQLTNTAYSQLVKAMTASLEMSKNCKAETYELCKPYAFEAMASLSQAAGVAVIYIKRLPYAPMIVW